MLEVILPYFQAAGHTKYSLAALNIQLQTNVTLSPNGAHQVMWHRFVNSKGGMGNNIPCDLYNEHINRLVKYIIQNMGPNLTEASLQQAACSVSTLHTICVAFDTQSGVSYGTAAHLTRPDTQDVIKVVSTVLSNRLLIPTLDSLHKWDIQKTKSWIDKKDYSKYRSCIHSADDSDEDDSANGGGENEHSNTEADEC